MDLDFPVNPPVGSTYTGVNGHEWMWDGVKWVAMGAGDGVIGGAFLPIVGGTMQGPLLVTPTGSATTRSVQDSFGDVRNVKDFGAAGNGATDDTVAVQAAFNAAASGGEVYFPAGSYILTGITLSASGSISVRGAGAGVTILSCSANGLAIALASGQRATVRDLSIVTTTSSVANTGLAITAPDQTASARVENVVLRGNTARTTAWQTGINLTGVGLPTLDDITVLMPDGTQTAGPTGILFQGNDAAHTVAGLAMSNSFMQGGQYGLRIGAYVEGVLLTNTTIIGGDYSVYWPHTAGAANMLEVANCHFNPGTAGVYANGVGFISITGTFFLRFNGPNWIAIDLVACNNIAISANNFYGSGVGSESGVLINNSSNAPVVITGNAFLQLGTAAITLAGNTAAATITGNNAGSMPGGAVFLNDTTGNADTNQAIANSFNGAPDISANPHGIAYAGLAGGSNAIGFSWNGTDILGYVDGSLIGGITGTFLSLDGGTLLGRLGLPSGNTGAPALGFGADDGTGISRSGAALLVGVTGTASMAFLSTGAQVYGNLTMLNSRILQLADATAATDALNQRTGDARYGRAPTLLTTIPSNVGPITSATFVNLAPITFPIPRGGNSRILVSVNLNCSSAADSQIQTGGIRLDMFPAAGTRNAFLYQTTGICGDLSGQFFVDVTGTTTGLFNVQVALMGGAPGGFNILAGSQIAVVDLGPI